MSQGDEQLVRDEYFEQKGAKPTQTFYNNNDFVVLIYLILGLLFIGAWGVGLATKRCDLNKIPLGNNSESWVLRSDGTVAHNGNVRHRLGELPEEGDMIVSLYIVSMYN